jgi:hypothetical protein
MGGLMRNIIQEITRSRDDVLSVLEEMDSGFSNHMQSRATDGNQIYS